MQGQLQSAVVPRRSVFGRGFVVLAAVWLVAQGHHGAMLGAWSDQASLAGNVCWLLILYCQLRLMLDWVGGGLSARRLHPDLLLLLLCVAALEIACQASGDPLARAGFGQMIFFAQPIILLFGFAALHRRPSQSL